MNRTRMGKEKRQRPTPGAAKLNVEIDKQLGKHSLEIAKALIDGAIEGDRNYMKIVADLSKDAESAQQCFDVVVKKTLAHLILEDDAAEQARKGQTETDAATPQLLPEAAEMALV